MKVARQTLALPDSSAFTGTKSMDSPAGSGIGRVGSWASMMRSPFDVRKSIVPVRSVPSRIWPNWRNGGEATKNGSTFAARESIVTPVLPSFE